MKKNELVILVKETLGLESKKEAEGFLTEVDMVVEAIANGLSVGDKVKLGNHIVLEKKHVEESTRVSFGKEVVIPAGDKLVVKLTATGKKLVK